MKRYVAFEGSRSLGTGSAEEILATLATLRGDKRIAVYDQESGRPVDLAEGEPEAAPKKAGRPKLGVVSKEVSLLPRHWAWLFAQRGGASATIRRLVDEARKANPEDDQKRRAVNVTHAFLWDLAGDQVGFEEAMRALFAHDFGGFAELISGWPQDIQLQALKFLEAVYP